MMAYFGKNDMAAALTIFQPTSAFECTNRFRSEIDGSWAIRG